MLGWVAGASVEAWVPWGTGGSIQAAGDVVMSLPVVVAIFAALFALFALVLGIASMAHGGPADQSNSNSLMRARVAFQAVALGALLLAVGFGFLR